MKFVLNINLFGACVVQADGEDGFEISGTKHRALFVLLATAPHGRRTRSFLQNILWGTSCYDGGRQNLRRALSDIKRVMGAHFNQFISSNNSDICLNMEQVRFVGHPGGGQFLEGIEIGDEGFEEWLRGIRANPEQIHSLFSPSGGQAMEPVLKPTIAILPFFSICGGDDNAILGDWLSEEISRSLSRSNLISVISHLSARNVDRQSRKLVEIRNQLGLDYCLSGTVREIDGTIVLDTDLLDTVSGQILLTRNFTSTPQDILSASSNIISEIVLAIGGMIASDSIRRTRDRSLKDLADHRLLMAGVGLMHQLRLSSFARSRELIEEATRRAPRAAESHAWLAEWYVMSVFNGWSTDLKKDTANAVDCLARALDIDPENAFCLTIDGVVNSNLLHRFDIAEARFERALSINPNESLSWLFGGILDAFCDNGQAAVVKTRHAAKLSPLDPLGYFFDSFHASANLASGDFATALKYADRSLVNNARHLSTHRARICALHNLDQPEEARSAAIELLRLQPDLTVSSYLSTHPAKNFHFGKLHGEALLAAGIPKGF